MTHALRAAAAAALLSGFSLSASAHVTLETPQATVGSSYKAVLRVPHGCGGSATITLRAEIPEGLIDVKPMPKPGWTVKTVTGPYAASYDNYGAALTSGVKQIIWSGGNLPDAFYDEFVFRGSIAKEIAGAKELYIPVVQECEKGVNNWVGATNAGKAGEPAPKLTLIAAPGAKAAHIGSLSIVAPWARATPGGAEVAGGYLKIENAGAVADKLIGGAADVAGSLLVHEMSMDNGVMKMRELGEGLDIPAGGAVELKPGGFHLMFMQLKQPLKEGDTFPVRLKFEKAGEVVVPFHVEAIGARGPGAAEEMHDHHH